MKAYIAAPIFNDHQRSVVDGLKELLELHEYEVFSPYHASQAIFKGRPPKDCTQEERDQVLIGNIKNLYCDLLLAWVGGNEGGFTDPGVIWEMGFFHSLQLNDGRITRALAGSLAFIHEDDVRQSMNLMLSGTIDAVVKGVNELSVALETFKRGGRSGMRMAFHPDRLLAQEREPVV